MKERLETAISGSFKFKPEIDRLHEEFADYNVTVLEPSTGWLYIPSKLYGYPTGFRPLPVERGMTIRAIEERFLQAIERSDFLYVYNPGGYFGLSTAMEMASAFYKEKPVFLYEPLMVELFEGDLGMYLYCKERTTIASPSEAAASMREMNY